jgi:23S rRNA (uracil1939-C5)-methyltransferase
MHPTVRNVQDEPLKTLEVEIERILPGGVGLAHAEGLTLFVSLAAPRDVVCVEIECVRGKVAFASIKEIIKPSPVRVAPPCPYFGRCGGCDFQQLNYEAQLKTKVEIIRDCLHRIGHIENPSEIKIHPSPNQWRYRARANWQFDPQTKRLGYFERGSNRVCDVESCAVLVPELQKTLEALRAQVADDSFRPERRDFEAVAGAESVSLFPPFADFQTSAVSRSIGKEIYYLNADTFFQTNHELLESLVTEAIGDIDGKTAIDLYCGVGLFTLPLARSFKQVVGVEASATASLFAQRNLQHAQLSNAQIVTSRVGDWLRNNSVSFAAVDFLLLDPPRSGAENSVVGGIVAMRPGRISYVSCDPATLARDLKKLVAVGYSLDSVTAFDMFPQTNHVETIARLSIT